MRHGDVKQVALHRPALIDNIVDGDQDLGDLQVFLGDLNPLTTSRSIFVFAEGWPSFSLGLQALQLQHSLWVMHDSVKAREEFDACAGSISRLSWSAMLGKLHSESTPPLILIQTSNSRCHLVFQACASLGQVDIIACFLGLLC